MSKEQEALQILFASQFGLSYKALYFVEYKDPHYPCNCNCHAHNAMFPESPMLHCIPCCDDRSYQRVLRYSGVFRTPHTGDHYFLFTDPDPENIDHPAFPPNNRDIDFTGMDVQYSHVLERTMFFSQLYAYTITPHRRSWDKLPKNRHNPVDLPIDFSNIKERSSGLL